MSETQHTIAEVAMGAVNELARQGGQTVIKHPHGLMQTGAGLVHAASIVAPGAVAAASAGTAAVISTATAAAVALAPIAVVVAVGYGCVKLFEWLDT